MWVKSYYENDIKKLRLLTGLSFSEWCDFND